MRTYKANKDTLRLHSNYIVNLSSKTLTPAQESVLQKGLGFAYSTPEIPEHAVTLERMTRSYRLRYYFRDAETTDPAMIPPFKPPSRWQPPKASPEIETYLQSLPSRLDHIPVDSFRPNLRKSERAALRELRNDNTVVIKKADKGSCVVMEDRDVYIQDGLNHLSDVAIYREVEEDPTNQLAIAINAYVKMIHHKGFISNQMKEYLTFDEPERVRTHQAYFLKKIHKNEHAVRPIVSGCSGPTERLSALMDYFLQPVVRETTSYTRDSKSVAALLETTTFPRDILLTTIDVTALYPSIPHEEGIQATLQHLYESNPQADDIPFPPSVASEMLHIILQKNYFEFNSTMYQQIRGTAMGTKMAPSFANLFMDVLERQFLDREETKPLIWKRYIDDILCIWQGTRQSLEGFLQRLKEFHETIKFTSETSENTVTFLDLEIHKGPRFERTGRLDIKPHYKNTNKFQYLHHASEHPRAMHKGIVRGELTRILRASSDVETYTINKRKLTGHFLQRGYTRTLIEEAALQVPFFKRPQLLEEGTRDTTRPPPPFIIRFDRRRKKKNLKAAIDPQDKTIEKPRICYTRNKTIGDSLVRARLPQTDIPPPSEAQITISHRPTLRSHSTPCGVALCRCCGCMTRKERIFSSATGQSFSTPPQTTCNSSSVIYLIECTRCPTRNQYVGQTLRPIKNRMAGHRAAYRLGTKKTHLYHHFRKRDHTFEDARVTIIQKDVRTEDLLREESKWMKKLKTDAPHGLNIKTKD